jgi:hypothetical protein
LKKDLLPLAVEKQLGIIGMKVMARGRILSSWTPPPVEQRSVHGKAEAQSQALDWIKSGHNGNDFFRWLELDAERTRAGIFGADRSEACPACGSKSISYIGLQKRWQECGKQWGQTMQTCFAPNRANILSGRWRL